MSLVAYGSSGEESDEDITECEAIADEKSCESLVKSPDTHADLCGEENTLPDTNTDSEENETTAATGESGKSLLFHKLPEPRRNDTVSENVIEEDDVIPTKTQAELLCEASLKKERGPVKITIPSLSEFKDVDEENSKPNKLMPSKKGTGLFALLPPPKAEGSKRSNALIPRILNNIPEKNVTEQANHQQKVQTKVTHTRRSAKQGDGRNFLGITQYDSNSDEEENNLDTNGAQSSTTDFFALNSAGSVDADPRLPDPPLPETHDHTESNIKDHNTHFPAGPCSTADSFTQHDEKHLDKVLVSNVINLPKEEILLKNKAEVGPKLPIPEQEYNVDSQGNVAFDEKAIEYLCGKRGIKRKEKEIDESNIIEINGEDIKPDEREWLVKALTEEPVQRPVSMHSMYGGGSQSKKKHQITYLAQQAKAMEVELKNQWAQNRVSRKQTQSKYGF